MLQKCKNILSSQKGQGLSEYGLIIALIAVVCILAVTGLGKIVNTKFNELKDAMENTGDSGGL